MESTLRQRSANGLRRALDQAHLRAHLDHFKKLSHHFIVKPDAPVGRPSSDLARVMGAVNAVILPAQMHGVRAHWVIRARRDNGGQTGDSL